MHRALTETRPAPRPAPGAAVPQQRLKQRSMRSAQLGKRRPTQGSARAPAGRAGRRPSYSQRASGFRWEEGKFTEHQYQELEWGITERERFAAAQAETKLQCPSDRTLASCLHTASSTFRDCPAGTTRFRGEPHCLLPPQRRMPHHTPPSWLSALPLFVGSFSLH